MSKSRPWSNGSAPCHLEWRSSRLLAVALLALGGLAAFAVIVSELPRFASSVLAVAAVAYGGGLARREWSRPALDVVIPPNQTTATLDGGAMNDLQLQWRGPLAFLQWRDADGRRRWLQGWPDNLGAPARRELRLAMAARVPARPPRSMAP